MSVRRVIAVAMGVALWTGGLVAVHHAARADPVTGPPTFGQPTMSGIGGTGFEQGIRIDSAGRVYTHAPDSLTSLTRFIWRSSDNGNTFKWLPAAAAHTGKIGSCVGGADTDLVTDATGNIYMADLTIASISTLRSTDEGKHFDCREDGVPDTALDRQWYAIDGNPVDPAADDSGTGAGHNLYLATLEGARAQGSCPGAPASTIPGQNVLVMLRSPAPAGFGAGGGAGSGGMGFGPANEITGLTSCDMATAGNDEVSPIASTTGKLGVTGAPGVLPAAVKHAYVIHDDATFSKIRIARCFPVTFGVPAVPDVQDPSGLNCDDFGVADLGDVPTGGSFPTARTGADWPTMAVDKAGNLYAAWTTAPVDPTTGAITGDTVLDFASSTDEGASWSTPVAVPLGSTMGTLHNNVFPFLAAGDDGRVDLSWIGTPGQPAYPSSGPDSCPNGQTVPSAPATVCNWYVFMTQTLNAHDPAPTFTPPILASDHFIHRGSVKTLIEGTGDNTLGDFFQMRIGPQGEAYISYADTNLRTHGQNADSAPIAIPVESHAMVARQNGGSGLIANAVPTGEPTPHDAVTDPSGDAQYEADGTVSPSASNLDIVHSSIAQPAVSDCHPAGIPCYRVAMTIADLDLAGGAPPGDSDANLVWLTQWLAPSATDPRGGRNFFVFAEATAGGPLACYSGDNGVQNNQDGALLTYPGRKAIAAAGACTAVPGPNGSITIDVPRADVTAIDPADNRLYEVTASTMTTQSSAACLCDSSFPAGQLFNVIDVAKAYTVDTTPPDVSACTNAPISLYPDRALASIHARNVDCITAYGLAKGHLDGTFGPTESVSRAQMASFVARLLARCGVALPANPPDAFPGDDAGPPHELAINQLAALGVLDSTTGQTGDQYNVSSPTRRDDMAQFLYNAYKLITGHDLASGPDAFGDDASSDNEAAINALAQAGVVQGKGSGAYDPGGSVSRAQFASFFARYIQLIVDAGKLPPL